MPAMHEKALSDDDLSVLTDWLALDAARKALSSLDESAKEARKRHPLSIRDILDALQTQANIALLVREAVERVLSDAPASEETAFEQVSQYLTSADHNPLRLLVDGIIAMRLGAHEA
jgi:hypothetical protein